MMALDKKAMHEKMPACDYFVSRKIDGEFSILAINGSSACTINPGGTVRVGLPVLEEAYALLGKSKAKTALLACELYVHRTDKRRASTMCAVSRDSPRRPMSCSRCGWRCSMSWRSMASRRRPAMPSATARSSRSSKPES